MSKVSIDYKELKSASNKIIKAYEKLDNTINKYNINITQIHTLKIDDQVRAASNDLTRCISQEKKLLQSNNEELLDIISKVKAWDTKRTKKSIVKYIKSNDSNKVTKKYKKLVSLLGAKKAKKFLENKASKLGYNVKISKNVVSLTKKKTKSSATLAKSTGAVVTNTKSIVSTVKSTSTTTSTSTSTSTTKKQKIKRLKQKLRKNLKNGNLVAAATTYSSLVALIGEDKAKAYLKKLGYSVTNKNGKVTISKTSTKKTKTDTKDDENSDKTQDEDGTDSDTTSDEISDTTSDDDTSITDNEEDISDDNSSSNESVATETVNQEEQDTTLVEQTSNKEESYNYNTKTQEVSTSTNGDDTSNQSSTDNTNSTHENTTVVDTEVDEANTLSEKEELESSNNVISITDDDDSFSSSKSSSSLGSAVPIGLGAIATGAAAVAGVRYVKSRHENQEEYDEGYDDEDNNLTNENQYVDSAQYDTDNNYLEDEYLGPAGSSYTDVDLELEEDAITNNLEESYIDPEELEESLNADFEDDSVLKELNNY